MRSPFSADLLAGFFTLLSGYLLIDPTTALGISESIGGPISAIFYVAKDVRDVRAAVPQAVLSVAAYCKQYG